MIIDISKITNCINKISDLTSSDKSIPGVLLELSENKLNVCYSDGHKSFIEKLDVTTEDGDHLGGIVVDFTQMLRAINNCQPSGIIRVSEVNFKYNEDTKIVTISADQNYALTDEEGNIVGNKTLANKKMDLLWTEPGSDIKSAILTRMKYDSIFDATITDKFDKKELIDALSKTSVEKGKQVYISTVTQNIFVANQAHVTSVPISGYEVTQEEQDEIRGSLVESGTYTDEAYEKAIRDKRNRIHFSVTMGQQLAKSLIGILNKISASEVYLHTSERYCNIFVDTDEEVVGIWFEMAQASRAHIGSLERYSSMGYKTYQFMFIREFLDNCVKSALNATKSEKVELKFRKEEGTEELGLIIKSSSAAASVADTYRVVPGEYIDPTNDIDTKTFNISLKVLYDMLAQLKTSLVGFDIEVTTDGITCIRLCEIDENLSNEVYLETRQQVEKLCQEQGIEFTTQTPTPVELKLAMRDKVMITKQYTMLAK